MSAVIVITSHGDIQVKSSKNPNETEEVEKYRFPRDMTIVSLNAVSPSVPNLLPPKNVAPFVKIVRDNTSIFNGRTSKKDMKNIVKIIREQILEMDDQPEDARTQVHSGNTYYTNDGEIMAYHYHSHELLYKIKTYTNGMIYNKEFLRENSLVKPRSSNWKINLLNSGPTTDEDLMDTLNPSVTSLRSASTRSVNTVTRMKNIIEELHNRGVRKLIIIDLSCSVIRKNLYGLTRRGDRNIALQSRRDESPESPDSISGGKTIRCNKSNDNKKTKKRYKR